MKLLLILTMLSSCALLPERKIKRLSPIDKLHRCVVDLIGRFNVKATVAEEVCAKIYKKGE